MINLDDMTANPDDLFTWWSTHQHATKTQRIAVFGHTGRGTVRALKDLAHYAANKGTAMQCRARGDIQAALMYETICDKIYTNLPDFARW